MGSDTTVLDVESRAIDRVAVGMVVMFSLILLFFAVQGIVEALGGRWLSAVISFALVLVFFPQLWGWSSSVRAHVRIDETSITRFGSGSFQWTVPYTDVAASHIRRIYGTPYLVVKAWPPRPNGRSSRFFLWRSTSWDEVLAPLSPEAVPGVSQALGQIQR
jgi:energy-coupling factor transporter transmembrane protein EcfT